MCLWICTCHAVAVVRLKIGIRNEEPFPRSFFIARSHPVPTTAIARPVAVIRILVRAAVAKDDYRTL